MREQTIDIDDDRIKRLKRALEERIDPPKGDDDLSVVEVVVALVDMIADCIADTECPGCREMFAENCQEVLRHNIEHAMAYAEQEASNAPSSAGSQRLH